MNPLSASGTLMQTVLLLTALAYASLQAQGPSTSTSDPEREAVLKVIQAFFDTMAAKDVAGARRVVLPEGRFHAVECEPSPLGPLKQ